MYKPSVSIIIGTGGEKRYKYLKLVLLSLKKGLYSGKREYILIEADSKPRVSNETKSMFEKYRYIKKKSLFNLGWVFNIGAKLSSGEILVFHDNDLLVPENFFTQIAKASFGPVNAGATWRYIKYLSKDFSNKLIERKANLTDIQEKDMIGTFPSTTIHGGSVWIKREAFFQIKGFPELFEGWGCVDDAFWLKARSCLRWRGNCPITLFHLYHRRCGIDAKNARRSNPYYRRSRQLLEEMVSWNKSMWEGHIKKIENWGNFYKYTKLKQIGFNPTL